MPEPTLHPNLAKIAASYDEIIDRLNRRTITPATAREQIAQLEARDDDGIRWSIDPGSGAWTRKTVFGDVEFDTAPPTFGYATPDAFDLTPNAQAFNPAQRLTHQAVSEQPAHPGSLYGATRRLAPAPPAHPGGLKVLARVPLRTRLIVAVLVAVTVTAAIFAVRAGSATDPMAPAPTATAPAAPAPAAG